MGALCVSNWNGTISPSVLIFDQSFQGIRGLTLPDKGLVFIVDGASSWNDYYGIKLFDYKFDVISPTTSELTALVSTSKEYWYTKSRILSDTDLPVGEVTYGGYPGELHADKAVALGFVGGATNSATGRTGPSTDDHDSVKFQIKYSKVAGQPYSLALEKIYINENIKYPTIEPNKVKWIPYGGARGKGLHISVKLPYVTVEPAIFYYGAADNVSKEELTKNSYIAGLYKAQPYFVSDTDDLYTGVFVLLPQ